MLKLLFRSHFTGIAVAIIMFVGLFKYSGLFRFTPQFYEAPDSSFQTKIEFQEQAQPLGIKNLHKSLYPPYRKLSPMSYPNLLSGVAPAIAVIDIDGDGFLDIYVTNPGLGEKNKLFMNKKGLHFVEEAELWGLADVNKEFFSEVPAFADVNGDGHVDLILGRSGCHSIYLNQFPKKKFVELKNALGGYCSNTRGFAVLDYNRDGVLDIFMGNYFADVDLNKGPPPWSAEFPRGDDTFGGKNVLLQGTGDGHFKVVENFDFPYKNHTFNPGVGDFNKDGWPDIFEGNDFSFDRLYYNVKGKYKEVTDSHIPKNRHGFAGMNSEVFDFDHDGWLDIYVTNIYGPPFSRGGNILWKGGPSGFQDVSDELGVRRCGWSWGAKFADFDLDGKEELIVGGGMVRGPDVHSETDGELYWYRVGQRLGTPKILRDYIRPVRQNEKLNYFGYQRGCLFQFNEKTQRYVDVAVESKFAQFDNSRALALIDFDNDGKVDVLTGNFNDYLKLFHNMTPTETPIHADWFGFDLKVSESSNSPVIGSRVRIFEKEKLVFYREIYPLNGHRGQNDPRIIRALTSQNLPVVEIKWPDGKLEIYKKYNKNSYNNFIKGQGVKIDEELSFEN